MRKLLTLVAFFSIFLTACVTQKVEICEKQEGGKCLYSSQKVEKLFYSVLGDEDFVSSKEELPEEQEKFAFYIIYMSLIGGVTNGEEPAQYVDFDRETTNMELVFDEYGDKKFGVFSTPSEFFDYVKKSDKVSSGFVFEKVNSLEKGSLIFVEKANNIYVFFALDKEKILGYFHNLKEINFGKPEDLKGEKFYYFVPKYYRI